MAAGEPYLAWTATDPALELVRPAEQLGHVIVGEALRRGGLHEQSWRGSALGPGGAGLVEVVVDPGGRAVGGVLVDRVDLPVGEPNTARPSNLSEGRSRNGSLRMKGKCSFARSSHPVAQTRSNRSARVTSLAPTSSGMQ
jgi:hypothetical protein